MSGVEFIGLMISLFFVLFILLRPIFEAKKKREHPQEYEAERLRREKQLKEMLRTLDIKLENERERVKEVIEEEEEDEAEEQAQRQKHQQQLTIQPMKHFSPSQPMIPAGRTPAPIRRNYMAYQATMVEGTSRGKKLLNRQPSRKEMILIQEIMNPPRGLE